jgi:hypothetical protein
VNHFATANRPLERIRLSFSIQTVNPHGLSRRHGPSEQTRPARQHSQIGGIRSVAILASRWLRLSIRGLDQFGQEHSQKMHPVAIVNHQVPASNIA